MGNDLMNMTRSLGLALHLPFVVSSIALAQREGTDEFFKLGPDSLKQEGVPTGKLEGPFTLPSKVFH